MRITAFGLTTLLMLSAASSANAVILYRAGLSGTGVPPNSTAPTGSLSTSGWQYQIKFGEYLGTPIGPSTFVTANHIAPGNGTTFTWNNETYTVTSKSNINDIAIVRVNKSFTSWAPLYDEASDGSLVGKQMVVFGRGIGRGAEVHLPTAPRAGESTLRGWLWDGSPFGDTDTQTWGTNTIDRFYSENEANAKEYILFDFDRNGQTEEATISPGDSGGAVFARSSDGIWKLVATNSGVESGYKINPSDAPFGGAIFDKGKLYQDNSPNPDYFNVDQFNDLPALAYASNVSSYLPSFASYVPNPGDANLDGDVNTQDFNLFAGHFGANSFNWADGDFNHDGVVNSADFTLFAANYGRTGTPVTAAGVEAGAGAVVPEPGHLLILALISSLKLLERRRSAP